MNKKDYFDEIDHIEADKEFKERMKNRLFEESIKTKRSHKYAYMISTVVACTVLLLGYAFLSNKKQDNAVLLPQPGTIDNPTQELAQLTLPEGMYGSYGYEGYFEKDPRELAYGKFDYKKKLKSLPVIKNQSVRERSGLPILGLSEEEMEKIAETYREKLNFTSKEEIYEYHIFYMECVEGNIEVEMNGEVTIEYYEVPTIASNILMNPENLEEANQVVNELLEVYEFLIPEGEYIPDLSLDYSYEAQQHWGFFAYERKDEDMKQLLAYHFNRIGFVPDEKGQLWMMRIQFKDASESLGDYPIINEEEATVLLKKGNFLTSCPVLKDMSQIVHVELTYYMNEINEAFLPYYKFYIEDSEFIKNVDASLKSYNTYYVPAIDEEYLVELPDNSIYFN